MSIFWMQLHFFWFLCKVSLGRVLHNRKLAVKSREKMSEGWKSYNSSAVNMAVDLCICEKFKESYTQHSSHGIHLQQV